MKKHSPEKIVEILHSIKELSVKDGYLDVLFIDSDYNMSTVEFVPETFTRQLLEVIEDYLLANFNNETIIE